MHAGFAKVLCAQRDPHTECSRYCACQSPRPRISLVNFSELSSDHNPIIYAC